MQKVLQQLNDQAELDLIAALQLNVFKNGLRPFSSNLSTPQNKKNKKNKNLN
jgi:hypothetical protein